VSRRALVIGYGNPLRGDDGAGPAIAGAVGEASPNDVEVIICHQLTPELSERIAAADVVVFVDAQAGAPPGSITTSRVQNESVSDSALAHHANPAALLSLSIELFGRSPQAFLVTVAAASFELGEALSQPVTLALPGAVAAVRQLTVGELHGG
jgi:hydrogenase maturation protease